MLGNTIHYNLLIPLGKLSLGVMPASETETLPQLQRQKKYDLHTHSPIHRGPVVDFTDAEGRNEC